MKATIDQLKKGDTVIVALGSNLAEVKILRQPKLARIGKLTTWYGQPRWSSLLCALREEDETFTSQSGHKWTTSKPIIAGDKEYNKEKRIDFTRKTCWIIKRE